MSSGLRQRVTTALWLAPLAVAAVLWTPSWLFAGLLAAAFLLGLWEWTRLACMQGRGQRAIIVALTAAVIATLAWLESALLLQGVIAAGVIWWWLALLWLRHSGFAAEPTPGHCALKTCAGALMIVAAWSALVLLRDGPDGPTWTLYALALVWVADIGAYFAGRAFGRSKLAPRISPGKTWAGVRGALAGTALFAALAGTLLFELAWIELLALVVLSLVSVAFSIVGDLFESLIKRHSKCKDSGSLLPGHGGVFDRIDSILAAAPVFVAGKLLLAL